MLRLVSLQLVALVILPGLSWADAPVSSGTAGALERSAVQSAGPGSSNAEFDPVQNADGQFQLRWLFPFYDFGDVSKELDVLPVEQQTNKNVTFE